MWEMRTPCVLLFQNRYGFSLERYFFRWGGAVIHRQSGGWWKTFHDDQKWQNISSTTRCRPRLAIRALATLDICGTAQNIHLGEPKVENLPGNFSVLAMGHSPQQTWSLKFNFQFIASFFFFSIFESNRFGSKISATKILKSPFHLAHNQWHLKNSIYEKMILNVTLSLCSREQLRFWELICNWFAGS